MKWSELNYKSTPGRYSEIRMKLFLLLVNSVRKIRFHRDEIVHSVFKDRSEIGKRHQSCNEKKNVKSPLKPFNGSQVYPRGSKAGNLFSDTIGVAPMHSTSWLNPISVPGIRDYPLLLFRTINSGRCTLVSLWRSLSKVNSPTICVWKGITSNGSRVFQMPDALLLRVNWYAPNWDVLFTKPFSTIPKYLFLLSMALNLYDLILVILG